MKHTNITRDWVPGAWLSRYQGEHSEQQGEGQGSGTLADRVLSHWPQLAHLIRTGLETDYPGTTCSPRTGVYRENLETC